MGEFLWVEEGRMPRNAFQDRMFPSELLRPSFTAA